MEIKPPKIMRPNIDKEERLLIRCECGCDSNLEIITEDDGTLWIQSTRDTNTLWECLRWWWLQRKCWWFELHIRDSDLLTIRNKIDRYLNK